MARNSSSGRDKAGASAARRGGGSQKPIMPCQYASKAEITVVVRGIERVTLDFPGDDQDPIEHLVNHTSENQGKDGKGAQITLPVSVTFGYIKCSIGLTCDGAKSQKSKVNRGSAQGRTFRVDAGEWSVSVTADGKKIETPVTIGAGSKKTIQVDFGATVYAKAAFTKRSKRNLPDPTELGWTVDSQNAGTTTCTREFVVADGNPDPDLSIGLDLGVAGGDQCKVEVGLSDKKYSDSRSFENWRKLEYTIFAPETEGPNKLSSVNQDVIVKSGDGPDFSGSAKDRIVSELKKVFLKFERSVGAFYDKEDAITKSVHGGMMKCAAFPEVGKEDDDVFVMSENNPSDDNTLREHLVAKHPIGDKTTTMVMLFCDLLTYGTPNEVVRFGPFTGETHVPLAKGRYLLMHNYRKPHENAYQYLTDISLTEFFDTAGVWVPVSEGHETPTISDGQEFEKLFRFETRGNDVHLLPVDAADDTGWLHRHVVWYQNTLVWLYEIEETENVDDIPLSYRGGQLVHKNGRSFKCIPVKIEFELNGQGLKFARNGNASRGNGAFAMFDPSNGPASWQGLSRTILHELGHNMGQVYGGPELTEWGRAAGDDIPGLPFPEIAPEGKTYEGHGHTGPHCASHITSEERKSEDYRDYFNRPGKCIMWGAGDIARTEVDSFCETCQDHIKAEDLSNISRKWGPNQF